MSAHFDAALERPMVRRCLQELVDRGIRWMDAVINGARSLRAGDPGRDPRTMVELPLTPLVEMKMESAVRNAIRVEDIREVLDQKINSSIDVETLFRAALLNLDDWFP